MSDTCDVCRRETFPNGKDGYQHNLCFRAVMPERECYRLGYERVTAEIAAAEERGRQRGVEEAAKIVRGFRNNGKDWRKGRQFTNGYYDRDDAIADAVAALAPRDSGKGEQ